MNHSCALPYRFLWSTKDVITAVWICAHTESSDFNHSLWARGATNQNRSNRSKWINQWGGAFIGQVPVWSRQISFPASANHFAGNYFARANWLPYPKLESFQTLWMKTNEWTGNLFCGKLFCLSKLVSLPRTSKLPETLKRTNEWNQSAGYYFGWQISSPKHNLTRFTEMTDPTQPSCTLGYDGPSWLAWSDGCDRSEHPNGSDGSNNSFKALFLPHTNKRLEDWTAFIRTNNLCCQVGEIYA